MLSKKKQCPIRLWEDDYQKVKAKTVLDKTNFQKVGEILFKLYLENNKEVMRAIQKYVDEKSAKRRRHNEFTDFERDELLRRIESDVSPIGKDFEKIIEDKR